MDGDKKRKNTSPQLKPRKDHKKGEANGHTTNKEQEGNYDITQLKGSILEFISTHESQDVDHESLVGSADDVYARIAANAHEFNTETKTVQEIEILLSNHQFNRAHLLNALLKDTNQHLPPLPFVLYLHNRDIVPFSNLLEKLPENRASEFANMLRESFVGSKSHSDSIFNNIVVALVSISYERPASKSSDILAKLCDPSQSLNKTKALNILVGALQRVARMRPENIPQSFFSNRLQGLLNCEDPASDISVLEDKVKEILHSTAESDKDKAPNKDTELKSALQKVFTEFSNGLPIATLAEILTRAASSLNCDWFLLTQFIRHLVSQVRDFGTMMGDQLHNMARDAFSNVNKDLLRVVLMLLWLVLPSNPYADWFTANFCVPATSLATTKNLRQMLVKVMTSLASVESAELSKCHRAIIKKFPDIKAVMSDYLAATDPVQALSGKDSGAASLDDSITSARAWLDQFRQEGTIPAKLKKSVFFKPTFLPTLLSLDEEQKLRPMPEFKDIHLFVAALQNQNVITQTIISNWKATQSDHTAKVRSALRLSKGRPTDKDKQPIDVLKSLLREFVDRTRTEKIENDGLLLTEIASRINELLTKHAEQALQCVNLLLKAFCEASSLLASEVESLRIKPARKMPGIQWGGDFVRRVMMLPSLRNTLRDRMRELTCVLALDLDEAHIACLALLLAHLASTTEGSPMTEDVVFVNEIFRQLHENVRNARWMGFAAKLCSRFVLAVPAVSSFVLAPDSYSDSLEETDNSADGNHDYSIVPPVVFKMLVWLKSRYAFGQQLAALCSSGTTLHQHNPVFSDFSATATLLSSFPALTFSKSLVTRSGIFTLKEILHAEMRVSSCGDFLDSTWKVEYLRKVVLDQYSDLQSRELIERYLSVILDTEKSDEVCPCGRVGDCNGKAAVLALFGELTASENGVDWTLSFLEKMLEKPIQSQEATNVASVLAKGLQAITHIHPSVFASNITVIKNLIYVLGNYLKFFSPFHSSVLPHEATHFSSLGFVFLARIFGYIAQHKPKWVSSIKDLIVRAPIGFFMALNCPVYKTISLFHCTEIPTIADLYAEVESVHCLVGLIFQSPRNSSVLSKLEHAISTLPAIAAHVLFHSTFTLCNLPTTISLKDKVTKVELLFTPLCNSLKSTWDTVSTSKTFEFLACFVDLLAFFLTSSPSFSTKQVLPASSKRESAEDLAEGLLVALLLYQPYLLSMFCHPIPVPALSTARESLFPVFSPSTFSRYPFLLFFILISLPNATIGKVMKGDMSNFWKEKVLDTFEKCKKHPHESYMSGTFMEQVEKWMCVWLDKFGVDANLATRFIPSFGTLSASVTTSLRQFTHS